MTRRYPLGTFFALAYGTVTGPACLSRRGKMVRLRDGGPVTGFTARGAA